jgi:hypothetical protein
MYEKSSTSMYSLSFISQIRMFILFVQSLNVLKVKGFGKLRIFSVSIKSCIVVHDKELSIDLRIKSAIDNNNFVSAV